MRISLSHLRELLPLELLAEEIAEQITTLGLEVDSVEPLPLPFEGVVIGEVVESSPHPEADRLQVARVSDGTEEFQVVCGAPNCRAGLRTALARPGALLHSGDKPFKIKKAKLRGVESRGMLCAASELGLGGESAGIMELEAAPGTPLSDLYGDTIFEISLTPNLGHCYSVLGIARELAAATETRVQIPNPSLETHGAPSIQVESSSLYSYRVIRGVDTAPSPAWLRSRLEAAGIRPRNRVVDATNYVMLELGQPLHAFDLATLQGNLRVRPSVEGEAVTTLDGVERALPANIPLICDEAGIAAIGGVMGAARTEVSEGTREILLEAAHFAPADVRRASSRLGLKTEASRRFERGVDPRGLERALDRAAELIGGEASSVKSVGVAPPRVRIPLRLKRVNRLLGHEFTQVEVERLLRRLEFDPVEGDVGVPSYRFDMHAEIDLIEEVARLYGYAHLESRHVRCQFGKLTDSAEYQLEEELRRRCVALGLQELMTPSLISPAQAAPYAGHVPLANAGSADLSVLRPSLLPGLLQVARHNLDHGTASLAGFEMGRIHRREGAQLVEKPVLALLLYGEREPAHPDREASPFDFLDLKGLVEQLSSLPAERSEDPRFHPGRQAGGYGQLHPRLLREEGIDVPVFYAELDLEPTEKGARIRPLPAFPGSERDWTVTLEERVPVGEIIDFARGCGAKLLQKVSLIAIYRGASVERGSKNVTFRFLYRDDRKTLSMESVEREHARVVQKISEQLGIKH